MFSTYLSKLELLLDIFDDSATLETHKCAADQLRVDRVGPHHLTGDTQQCADFRCGQLSHSVTESMLAQL